MIPSISAICLIFIFPNAFALLTTASTTAHDNKAQVSVALKLPPSQESEVVEVQQVIEIRQASPAQSSSTSEAFVTFDPATTAFPDNSLAAITLTPETLSNFASSPTYNILGWQAPDNTCGYVGGLLAKIKTCDINAACDVITTHDSSRPGSGVIVGCCQPNVGCNFFGNCIESADYFSAQSACVPYDNCTTHQPNTVLCIASTAPYCVSYSFAEWGASLYECAATPVSSVQLIQTTFAGQTDPRIWVPIFSSIGTSIPTATSFLLGGPTAQPTVASVSNGRPVPGSFPYILIFLFRTLLCLL